MTRPTTAPQLPAGRVPAERLLTEREVAKRVLLMRGLLKHGLLKRGLAERGPRRDAQAERSDNGGLGSHNDGHSAASSCVFLPESGDSD